MAKSNKNNRIIALAIVGVLVLSSVVSVVSIFMSM
jgi:hypothetical protein